MQDIVSEKIELVKNRLFHFEETIPNYAELIKLPTKEAEKQGFFIRDFGMNQWDWPQGIAVLGLHMESEENDEFIQQWANEEIAKGLPTKNINTITPLLTLSDFAEFEDLSLEWMAWLENSFPRTQEDGLEHITSGDDKYSIKRFEEQIWIDSLVMTALFIGKMGVKYNNKKWQEESVYQYLLHSKYLLDSETSLFYHGWNFKEKSNYGGNFWCRGNSWFTLGIPLYLSIMAGNLTLSTEKYLRHLYNNQVSKLLELRGDEGLWHTILDDSTSYVETSGSSGIVAGILIGHNNNLLDIDISDNEIEEMVQALLNKISDDGTVLDVSAGTAISKEKEDYKKIMQTPMVYGQAMMLVALGAYKKFKQK